MALIDQLVKRRIYLDSNVFIYAFEDYPAYHEDCANILDGIDAGLIEAVASELVFLEILYRPLQSDIALAERYVETMESVIGLFLMPVTRSVILRAAVMRVEARLNSPDAIHLATAIEAGCNAFVTNDRGIKSSALELIYLDPQSQ
jgi:predicted nucleic acid-binding protein